MASGIVAVLEAVVWLAGWLWFGALQAMAVATAARTGPQAGGRIVEAGV